MKNILYTLVFLLLPYNQVLGQAKVSCDAPKGIKWTNKSEVSIEDGKRECASAEALAKRANGLYDDAKDHADKAERQRKHAKQLRDDAKDTRKMASERGKESKSLHKKYSDQVKDLMQQSEAMQELEGERGSKILFQIDKSDTTVTPSFNNQGWAEAKDASVKAYTAYQEALGTLAKQEAASLDEISDVYKIDAKALEDVADLSELRAGEYKLASATAEQLADKVKAAAAIREQAATLFILKASVQFLEEKGEDKNSKKDLDRAINYLEKNLDKLPLKATQYAQSQISRSQEAMK